MSCRPVQQMNQPPFSLRVWIAVNIGGANPGAQPPGRPLLATASGVDSFVFVIKKYYRLSLSGGAKNFFIPIYPSIQMGKQRRGLIYFIIHKIYEKIGGQKLLTDGKNANQRQDLRRRFERALYIL